MTIQRPKYFGWEGAVFWSPTLFPVNPPTKYDIDATELNNWWLNAARSDDPIQVDVRSQSETVEMTPINRANRGFRTVVGLPPSITVGFTLHHETGTGQLVHGLLQAWSNRNELALAFADQGSGVGQKAMIGNFMIDMEKAEPLRRLQRWSVTCTPFSFIDWVEA